jgi:hypothetical protein
MEFLSRDIKSSDFTGCLSDKSEIENLLLPIGGFDEEIHPFFALGGINAYIAGDSDTLGSKFIKPGTDVLQLVGSEPVCSSGYELSENTDTLAPLNLRQGCDIDNGTVLLVTNCQVGNIFVKTGGGDNLVEHSTNSVAGLQNSQNRFTSVFGEDASLMKPYVRTYFISESVAGGDALFFREDGRNFELTSNVSNLNFSFGVDSDFNGTADTFILTSDFLSVDSRSVVSVRVEITAGNDIGDIARNYVTTVNIRNRMVPAYTLSISGAN